MIDNCYSGEAEKEMPLEKRRERRFAMHSQERIMGLLGAVMPHNDKKVEFCFSVSFCVLSYF